MDSWHEVKQFSKYLEKLCSDAGAVTGGLANSIRKVSLGPAFSLKLTRSQLPARIYLSTAAPQLNRASSLPLLCELNQVLCSTQTAGKHNAFCNWCHIRARCRRCACRRCKLR